MELKENKNLLIIGGMTVLVIALGYFIYNYYSLTQEFTVARAEFATTTATLKAQITDLQTQLVIAAEENIDLDERLQDEQERNDGLANQVGEIAETVNTLEKLSQTDEELLQKYSKVYFLNEHYVPKKLVDIPEEYRQYPERMSQIQRRVWSYLRRLLKAAENDDFTLKINSAYRSFTTQSSLKSQYKILYGAGSANQFSADQGYSEHQLGTTVDLTTLTDAIGDPFLNFHRTEAYQWLLDNAYRYGFILSYPENNTYYQFEPWHWRFVGEKLAADLHEAGKHFYDLDQREIDTYLVNIFD